MDGEGMAAVVQGCQDSGLIVTVMDGNKKYTFAPTNSNTSTDPPPRDRRNGGDMAHHTHHHHHDSYAQAVDGRYTSTYQASHCNVRPTSPPVQLSEFPPQRQTLNHGQSNFEVGGLGSGETFIHNKSNYYKGAMVWPDRGCVCSSARISQKSNPFADSLRKYPSVSPERTTEIAERLLNSSPTKNLFKSSNQRYQQSPTRLVDSTSYTMDRSKSTYRTRAYDPEFTSRTRNQESPTKEKRREFGCPEMKIPTEYDVRCLKDMSKIVQDCVRSVAHTYKSALCRNSKETSNRSPRDAPVFTNSVSTESKATVKMVSRTVATVPEPIRSRRTIAVSITPTSTSVKSEGVCCCTSNFSSISCKLIQTTFSPLDIRTQCLKSVQTTSSSVELNREYRNTLIDRKSKSQEEIRTTDDDFRKDVIELLEDLSICSQSKRYACDDLVTRLTDPNKRKVNDDDENHQVDRPSLIISECELDMIIKKWISGFNIRSEDFLGRPVDREDNINLATQRIKTVIVNRSMDDKEMKLDIFKIIEDMPMKSCCNKRSYLNRLIDILFERLNDTNVQIFSEQTRQCAKKSSMLETKRKISLTEDNLKILVRDILMDFLEEFNQIMCENLIRAIVDEIVDLLINFVDFIRCGNEASVRTETADILKDLGQFTDKQASHFANILLHNMREILNLPSFHNTRTVCNFHSKQDGTDRSVTPINENDINANVDRYTRELSEQIDEWLNDLNMPQVQETGFRRVVVNDLAEDIVDRHKYQELNPNSRGTDSDELENLKFQIFKWINKLVGEDNLEILEHAQGLMDKIKSVPIPMLTNIGKSTNKGEIARNKGRLNFKEAPNSPDRNRQKKTSDLINSSYEISENNDSSSETFPRKTQVTFDRVPKINTFGGGKSCDMECKTQDNNTESVHRSRWKSRQFEDKPELIMMAPSDAQSYYKPNLSRVPVEPAETGEDCCPLSNNLRQAGSKVPVTIPRCCTGKEDKADMLPSLQALNEEYDDYLIQWVKEIPIAVTTPEQQKLADLARLGIYNGIWKAITKLKLHPTIFNNPYHYQDVLDEDIEELLMHLPQTKELESNKHRLKAQLLEKTVNMNEQIKAAAIPASFKQQLIENLNNHLPKISKFEESLKQQEILLKKGLVENYILFTRYQDIDNVKCNVYRKNFLKKIEDLADIVKHKLRDEAKAKDNDPKVYVNELISAVSKVPLPNDQTIREEANKILLSMEVDHWLSDLPLKTSIDPLEQMRLRDTVTNKILEIGTRMNLSDCSTRTELQKILPRYIDKLPLEEGTDLAFLIEELANRLKNLPKDEARRQPVSFQEPHSYMDFSRNMPGCSSRIRNQGTDYESSYMVVGGEIVRDPEPKGWVNFKESVAPEQEWFSMEQTRAPSGMLDSSQGRLRSKSGTQPYESSMAGQVPHCQNLTNQAPMCPNRSGDASHGNQVSAQPQCGKMQSREQQSPYRANSQVMSKVQSDSPQRGKVPSGQTFSNDQPIQNSQPPNNTSQTNQKSNLQRMAGGGLGVLGTSQVAGSSKEGTPAPQISKSASYTKSRAPESCKTERKEKEDKNEGQLTPSTANVECMTTTSHDTGPVASGGFLNAKDSLIANVDSMTNTPIVTGQASYATPYQPISQAYPERPQKKPQGYPEGRRLDAAKRRLVLDDSEYETENERDNIRCPYIEQYLRLRRRRLFCCCDHYICHPPYVSVIRNPYYY